LGRREVYVISISKYLNSAQKGRSEQAPQSEGLLRFSQAVLRDLQQFVLTPDGDEGLRSQLLQLQNSLRSDLTEAEVEHAEQSISSILAAHRASSRRAGAQQVMEMQHVFDILNQALVVLTEGSDRGTTRLAAIQESLQKTARMQDVTSIK